MSANNEQPINNTNNIKTKGLKKNSPKFCFCFNIFISLLNINENNCYFNQAYYEF